MWFSSSDKWHPIQVHLHLLHHLFHICNHLLYFHWHTWNVIFCSTITQLEVFCFIIKANGEICVCFYCLSIVWSVWSHTPFYLRNFLQTVFCHWRSGCACLCAENSNLFSSYKKKKNQEIAKLNIDKFICHTPKQQF